VGRDRDVRVLEKPPPAVNGGDEGQRCPAAERSSPQCDARIRKPFLRLLDPLAMNSRILSPSLCESSRLAFMVTMMFIRA